MSDRSQNTENYGSGIKLYIAIYHSNICKPKSPKYLEKVTKFTNSTFSEVVQNNLPGPMFSASIGKH